MTATAPTPTVQALEWEVRLWESRPTQRRKVLVAAGFAAVAAVLLFGRDPFPPATAPFMALVGFATIVVSTAELFFPLRYRLDGEDARVRCGASVTAIRWADVKRLVPMEDGVKLSPLAAPSRLDAFRGVYLRYAGNEGAVLDTIRALWNSDADVLGSGAHE